MYTSITNVLPSEDYFLTLQFEDGQTRRLDMKPFLNFGVFNQLKKIDAFRQVHVAFDTIEWDCGVDLDPEFVFQKSIAI